MLKSRPIKCYVALDSHGRPCYMQCLVRPSEMRKLCPFFEGSIPALAGNEVLLEFAFTHEAFRGNGVMTTAMAQIAEKVLDFGARWVTTYVAVNNIPALKACERAGFVPFEVRQDSWRFFQCHTTFTPLPAGNTSPCNLGKSSNGDSFS